LFCFVLGIKEVKTIKKIFFYLKLSLALLTKEENHASTIKYFC